MDRPFRAYDGDEPFVSVSYAHRDAELVYPELERLNGQGFKIWYDEGISPGAVWREELGVRIESCSLFLLFVSRGSSASDHCMKELNFALENDRPLLAVHLAPAELSPGLRLSLSDRQAILKYEVSEAAYRVTLTEAIEARVAAGTPAPVACAPRRRYPHVHRPSRGPAWRSLQPGSWRPSSSHGWRINPTRQSLRRKRRQGFSRGARPSPCCVSRTRTAIPRKTTSSTASSRI